MNAMQDDKTQSAALSAMLSIVLVAAISVLPGCGRDNQTADSTKNQPVVVDQPGGDDHPLGQVTEFDGFTLRANVSPTEFLSDSMTQRYGIEAGPNLALLNVVVMEKRSDEQPATVSADVSAQYETLIGHVEVIDMRAVEADGHVSYIGTLDTSVQRIFRFAIEAQPAGAEESLQMTFEVQLPTLDTK